MAVSGSTDFNIDAAEVIQEAYERCGLQEITGKDLRTAVRSMNLLMAEWANRGLNLWTIQLGTQAMTASDPDYSLDTNIIDLLEVSIRDSNNLDTSLARLSRADYHMLPNKSTTGKPSQFYFERTTTPTLFAGMAYYLAMKKAPEKIQLLKAVYDEEFERARIEDRDRASFSAIPSRGYLNNY